MNPYITGGYGAAAGILGAYALYVRHRVRVLARALPAEEPERVGPASEPDGPAPEGP